MKDSDYKRLVLDAYRLATVFATPSGGQKEPAPEVVAALVLAISLRGKLDEIGSTLEEIKGAVLNLDKPKRRLAGL